ncbi:hypothetical protein [Paenibacillus sp. An7]|uniref:hypothetical protein n=1 Tax=Paenibacillus sp. An7 TaxID=2689577 RepID=UPI00135C5B07|nr:hypothetical protein [Paenibacillus sp. An7]
MSELFTGLTEMFLRRNQQFTQPIYVSESATGDMEFKESNGEVLGEIHSGVYPGQYEMSLGNETATITENVMGGSKIDFGGTDVINSVDNIYGGENFNSYTDVVGYTKPSPIDGGMDFFNGNYEKVANISNPDQFGTMDFSLSTPSLDTNVSDFVFPDFSLVDQTYDLSLDTAVDGGDTITDILDMITEWI